MTTSDIQCLFRRKGILLTVDDDHTVALATVHDTELTVVQEILLLDGGIDIETQLEEVLQFQGFRHRHGTTKNKTIVMRVGQVHFVSLHHLLHDETVTQGLRVVMLHISRMTGSLELHTLLSHRSQCAHHKGHHQYSLLHFHILFLSVYFPNTVIRCLSDAVSLCFYDSSTVFSSQMIRRRFHTINAAVTSVSTPIPIHRMYFTQA